MKGLNENRQDEKGQLEHWKLAQVSSLQRNLPKTHLSEFTPAKLGFFQQTFTFFFSI